MTSEQQPGRAFAAVDLGASSGRVAVGLPVVGSAAGAAGLEIIEVHRFPNGPLERDGELVWDADGLFAETLRGLAAAVELARSRGRELDGIGIDSWGVDYGLLPAGVRAGNDPARLRLHVKHHRGADEAGPDAAAALVPEQRAYAITGVLPQSINTAFQLRTDVAAGRAGRGESVLLVPDLWVHLLTGAIGAERTIASTGQLLDVAAGEWSRELVSAYGLDGVGLPPLADPGERAGVTTAAITERIGARHPVPVYRVAEHDTASALAFAEPDAGELLVSSGSWSLAGYCLRAPVLTEAARAAGYTNELGVRGRHLLLRNLSGMWLLAECVRAWSRTDGAPIDQVALLNEALAAPDAGAPVFDVGDPRLLAPGDMPSRIAALCSESGRPAPRGRTETVRSIVESLAAAYADAARSCAELTGIPVRSVRIVGGGSRNELLCRRTAELTGLPVVAGPAEASALGNLAVQLVAAREFPDLAAVYAAADRTAPELRRYEPEPADSPPPPPAAERTAAMPDNARPASPRDRLVALSRELGRADREWALLAEGNTSVRVGENTMLVKASGASMGQAGPGDFVELALPDVLALVDDPAAGDDDVRRLFDAAATGGKRPSVEALLHAVCLDLPGVDAVGHTHPIPVNALLCSPRASALTDGSLFPDQIVVLGVNPLLVPYVDPGLKLAQAVRGMLREHTRTTGLAPKVVYLQNHGMFALGASDTEVLQITEMAVKVARILIGAIAAGGPVYLAPEEVARIDTRPDELLRRAALSRAGGAREGE